MTLKGKKQGKTVVLEIEPPVADGTVVEVEFGPAVDLAKRLKAQREALLSVGYFPDFGDDIEKIRQEWKPEEF